MENSNDSAFPTANSDRGIEQGLTKREYFAAMAMQGILGDQTFIRPNEYAEIATRSIDLADQLLKQLELVKEEGGAE